MKMSKRRRRSGFWSGSARRENSGVAAELLEQRCCLTGNVKAVLTGTGTGATLTLTGDAQANDITIEDNGSNLIVTGNNETKIGGEASKAFNALGGTLSVKLGEGDDAVTIQGGLGTIFKPIKKLTLDLGNGNNALTASNMTVNGDLSIIGGTGNDTVQINEAVATGGNISVNLGAGENSLTTVAAVTIGGTLSIIGGNGNDNVLLGGLVGTKSLTVNLGNGANSLTTEVKVNATTSTSITGGVGNDTMQLNGEVVTPTFSVNLGGGVNSLTTGATVNAKTSVSITGGAGGDTVQLNGGVLTKKLTATLSDGNDTFNSVTGISDVADFETNPNAKGTILTVDLGKGDDSANVQNVFGNIVLFTLGDGNNTFVLNNINALKLTLNGGTGNDNTTVDLLTTDNFFVNLGNGANSLTATNPYVGKLDYTGGAGTDQVTLSDTDDAVSSIDQLFVKLGLGDDSLTINSLSVFLNINIDGGVGTDTFTDNGGARPTGSKFVKKNFE